MRTGRWSASVVAPLVAVVVACGVLACNAAAQNGAAPEAARPEQSASPDGADAAKDTPPAETAPAAQESQAPTAREQPSDQPAEPPATEAPQPAPPAGPAPPAPSVPPPAASAPPPTPPATASVLDRHLIQGVLGKDVRSSKDEDMGRIVDVIVDYSGQTRAAVIDFGGFIGVGSRRIAVAWNALRFAPDEKGSTVTLDLTRDQLKAAPEYKEGKPVVVLGPSGTTETVPDN
jgi:PRC-barrel domain